MWNLWSLITRLAIVIAAYSASDRYRCVFGVLSPGIGAAQGNHVRRLLWRVSASLARIRKDDRYYCQHRVGRVARNRVADDRSPTSTRHARRRGDPFKGGAC